MEVEMSKPDEYKAEGITVFFDSIKCIHSRNCVLGLPKVFRANQSGEWVAPGNAIPEEVAAVIRNCPSGALTYKRSGSEEKAPHVNVVRVLENGPLYFNADLLINGKDAAFRATLCRCGASKNKPFCDGSHRQSGFEATGEPETAASNPLEERGGPLMIKTLKDGPLSANGNLEICSGTGRTVDRVEKAALCRCGASSKKPFCDGSHVKAGFRAG